VIRISSPDRGLCHHLHAYGEGAVATASGRACHWPPEPARATPPVSIRPTVASAPTSCQHGAHVPAAAPATAPTRMSRPSPVDHRVAEFWTGHLLVDLDGSTMPALTLGAPLGGRSITEPLAGRSSKSAKVWRGVSLHRGARSRRGSLTEQKRSLHRVYQGRHGTSP
jgi:hypothetical protein